MLCTPQQILFGRANQEECVGRCT